MSANPSPRGEILIHICIHMCVYIHAYACTYTYVRVYIHVCMLMFVSPSPKSEMHSHEKWDAFTFTAHGGDQTQIFGSPDYTVLPYNKIFGSPDLKKNIWISILYGFTVSSGDSVYSRETLFDCLGASRENLFASYGDSRDNLLKILSRGLSWQFTGTLLTETLKSWPS